MCVSAGLIEGGAQIAQGISDFTGSKAQAKVLRAQGQQAVMAANADAAQIGDEGKRIEGSNRASLAAAGLDMNSASAQAIAMEGAQEVQRDVDLTLYRGRVTGVEKENEARLAKRSGRASLITSSLKGAASFAKAAESYASAGAGGGG